MQWCASSIRFLHFRRSYIVCYTVNGTFFTDTFWLFWKRYSWLTISFSALLVVVCHCLRDRLKNHRAIAGIFGTAPGVVHVVSDRVCSAVEAFPAISDFVWGFCTILYRGVFLCCRKYLWNQNIIAGSPGTQKDEFMCGPRKKRLLSSKRVRSRSSTQNTRTGRGCDGIK